MVGTLRARGIVLLAAAGLLSGCGFFAYRTAVRLRQNLGPLLLAQLRAQLGPGISIGGVDYQTPGMLTLTRVRVADPTRPGQPLVETPRIVARYRLGDLLLGGAQDAAGAVERIEIESPRLWLARDPKGEWNFQRLLKSQPKRPPTRFRGSVVIRGGSGSVEDRAAPSGMKLVRTTLQGLDARVSARDMPRLLFEVEARVNGRGGGSAAVQGYYRDDTRTWLGRLKARDLDAPHWLAYFARPSDLKVEGGRADVQLVGTGDDPKKEPQAEGKIRLRGTTLRIPGLGQPLTGGEIELAGTKQLLSYHGRGLLAGAPVRFWGDSLPGLTPDFRLRFRAAPEGLGPLRAVFPEAELPADMVAEGAVEIEGEVAGHGTEVAVTGKARAGALAYEGVRAVAAAAEWRAVGRTVEVSHFEARALGGRVEGQGWFTPGAREIAAGDAVQGEGSPAEVDGVADGVGERGDTPAAIEAIPDRGESRDGGSGLRDRGRQGRPALRPGSGTSPGAQAMRAGMPAPPGKGGAEGAPGIYLRLSLECIDLAQLPRQGEALGGTASGEAVVRGTMGDLRGSGNLRATDLRVGKATIADASASLTYGEGKLGLRDVVLRDPLASARLSGTVDLTEALSQARQAGSAQGSAGELGISRGADAAVGREVPCPPGGEDGNPSASDVPRDGSASRGRGSLSPYRGGQGTSRPTGTAGCEDPGGSRTQAGKPAPLGAGELPPAGLDLEVDLIVPELQRVAAEVGQPEMRGEGRFRGRIGGTTAAPKVEGRLRVVRPRLGEVELDLLEATLAADPPARRLVLTAVRAAQLPAVATAERIEVTQRADGRLAVNGQAALGPLSVAHLLRLGGGEALLKQEPVTGTITGATVAFCGPLDDLEVELQAAAEGVAVRGLTLGQVAADLQADMGTREVRVRSLTARHGEQQLGAAGSVTLPGAEKGKDAPEIPVALTLTVENLPLLPLARRFAPQLFDYVNVETALRSLRVTVSGTDRRPVVRGELETTRVALNGLGFAPLRAKLGWRPGVATVSDLALVGEQGGRLTVPGLAWLYPEELPARPAELLGQVLGAVRLQGLPLRVAKRLVQQSPLSERSEAAPLLAALQHLTPAIQGELDVEVEFPCSVAAAAELTDAARAAALAERGRRPVVALRVGIPDLSLTALTGSEAEGEARVRPVHLKVETQLAYQQERIDIHRAVIDELGGDALVTARGWLELRGGAKGRADRIQVELDAVNLPLSALGRLPLEQLNDSLKPFQPLNGMAEVHAVATGAAQAPNVQLSASIDNLKARGYALSALNADQIEISAEEGKLRLLDVDLVQRHADHTHRVRLAGEVPFSWSLPGIVPKGERDLTITAEAQSLDVLNDLSPEAAPGAPRRGMLADMGVTGGTIEAKVRLQGTADSPQNSGSLHLRGGRVRLGKGETTLEDVGLDLKFAGTEVQVEKCQGRSNRSGGFRVTGRILLGKETNAGPSADLDLGLHVDQFRFVEDQLGQIDPGLKGTTVRGTLQTVDKAEGKEPEPIRITGPWTRPTVRGALRLAQASTGVPAGLSGGSAVGKLLVDPRLDLRLYVGDDVLIKNRMVEMRLKGMVAVTNMLSAPVVAGRLNIPRGSMQLPTMRFRTDGTIRIAYDGRPTAGGAAPPPPVYLELRGVTHVRRRESEGTPAEDVEIVMTVRGAPTGAMARPGAGSAGTSLSGKFLLAGTEGLTVEFSSEPALPYPQIAALIRQQMGVEGIFTNEANLQTVLRSQVQLALANSVAPIVTSRIEDYVQRALGLDTFAIDIGAPEQPLQLRAGKRIYAGLYGSFAQQLGAAGESRRSYELYYRLSRGLRAGLRQEDSEQRQIFFLSGSKRFR